MPVANCAQCNAIFQRGISAFCPKCHRDVLQSESTVYRFIKEHPGLTLDEISQQCGLSLKAVENMVFSGKLGTAVGDILYHCQYCNRNVPATMLKGRFCMECGTEVETKAGLYEKEPAEEKKDATSLVGTEKPAQSATQRNGNEESEIVASPAEPLPAEQSKSVSPTSQTYGFIKKPMSEV